MTTSQSTKVERICETCQKTFYRFQADMRKGPCRFCSRECALIAPRTVKPIEVRFRRHVGSVTERGCQPWTGAKNSNGYGNIKVNGKTISASRIAWELANGAIPDGMHICHTCDNPACVAIAHLFPGTHQDNMADKNAKGRVSVGERNASKLITSQVIEIRELYKAGHISIPQLAARFGVANTTVHSIIHRRKWKHIP